MTENSEWLNEALRNLSADPGKTYRFSLHTNDPGAEPMPPSEITEIKLPSINDPMTVDGIVLYDGNQPVDVEVSGTGYVQQPQTNTTETTISMANLTWPPRSDPDEELQECWLCNRMVRVSDDPQWEFFLHDDGQSGDDVLFHGACFEQWLNGAKQATAPDGSAGQAEMADGEGESHA